jgi:hypothetical protein
MGWSKREVCVGGLTHQDHFAPSRHRHPTHHTGRWPCPLLLRPISVEKRQAARSEESGEGRCEDATLDATMVAL